MCRPCKAILAGLGMQMPRMLKTKEEILHNAREKTYRLVVVRIPGSNRHCLSKIRCNSASGQLYTSGGLSETAPIMSLRARKPDERY